MYVVLVNDDDTLTHSKKERIMQRSQLFSNLWFLVEPRYHGYDMKECTATLKYILPNSKEYRREELVLSDKTFKGYLKYELPITTEITKEAGRLNFRLTFTLLDLDNQGNIVQRVRQTDESYFDIVATPAWDSIVPDAALEGLDQRIIKMDAQMKVLSQIADTLDDNKADGLKYQDSALQLLANGKPIGNQVLIPGEGGAIINPGGSPVVDFGSVKDDTPSDDDNPEVGTPSGDKNVVEF